ncbi:hypothetical protein FGO68_gene12764 [Halteria grandinella]|uniref:Uncharacterized protein n=1 Tax=Halteria grandinella TaxID=5974 RepID=A0A8J8T7N5_HALGN|nr:hypothetical protein FGO68_gene12764 [Halteria grandinella]
MRQKFGKILNQNCELSQMQAESSFASATQSDTMKQINLVGRALLTKKSFFCKVKASKAIRKQPKECINQTRQATQRVLNNERDQNSIFRNQLSQISEKQQMPEKMQKKLMKNSKYHYKRHSNSNITQLEETLFGSYCPSTPQLTTGDVCENFQKHYPDAKQVHAVQMSLIQARFAQVTADHAMHEAQTEKQQPSLVSCKPAENEDDAISCGSLSSLESLFFHSSTSDLGCFSTSFIPEDNVLGQVGLTMEGMQFSLEDMNMQMEDTIPCNRIPDIQNESLKVAWAFNLTEHQNSYFSTRITPKDILQIDIESQEEDFEILRLEQQIDSNNFISQKLQRELQLKQVIKHHNLEEIEVCA